MLVYVIRAHDDKYNASCWCKVFTVKKKHTIPTAIKNWSHKGGGRLLKIDLLIYNFLQKLKPMIKKRQHLLNQKLRQKHFSVRFSLFYSFTFGT